MLKYGERVKCTRVIDCNHRVKNAEGIVVGRYSCNRYDVYFDEYISGHSTDFRAGGCINIKSNAWCIDEDYLIKIN